MSHRVESEQRNYFTSVQSQLSATVVEPLSSMGQTYSENAKSGVSPSLNAVDTGMKAAMTLSGLGDAVFSSLAIPALGALGLKGMACLPISKQLDPVMGVDAHIMVPPGSPVPAPYIGILIYPKDFLAIAIASVIPPPPPMPEEGEGAPGEADAAKACEIIHTLATMAIGMLGATVKIGNFIPRAVAGTTTRSIPHIGNFVPPPMNRGHADMGSLNVLADGDPLSGGGAHLHMDCWDIGLVTPHAVKKEADYFALFLPTGMIVPIPWFKPILTNPIPIPINPMEAAKRFIMGRFAGYYKKKMKRIIVLRCMTMMKH